DSLSTDRTVAIAKSRGAHVTERSFDDYSTHRNAAIKGLPFKHEWVLSVDADERIPGEVVKEMQEFVAKSPQAAAECRMRLRDFHERRFHQKGIVYQLPFRPLIKFSYMMLYRRAFLDGRPGTAYAFLQSIYEYFIVLKTRELLMLKKSTTVGLSEQTPKLHDR